MRSAPPVRPEDDMPGSEILARTRELGPLLDELAPEIERGHELPARVVEALIERDMFRLLQPREYGGAELAPTEATLVFETVARHDASTAWCLNQNNVTATVAAYLEPDAAREIFASPRDILSWGPGPGEARPDGDGYRLSGRFDFASGSRHSTWLGAHVPVVEPDGTRRTGADGAPVILTLLFRREQVKVHDTWQVIGLKGTGSDSFEADDLFVPGHHAVRRDGSSPRRVDGPLYAFGQSPLYACGFASTALGIARATLDAFIADIRDTVPRGARRSRGDNNKIQSDVGHAEARIRSSRALLRTTLEAVWADLEGGAALTPQQTLSLRMATTWAIQQSREVVTSLYLAAGALAIFESRPFERRLRDIHTLCQQIQGHAAHFETIGQILLGLEPDRSLFNF